MNTFEKTTVARSHKDEYNQILLTSTLCAANRTNENILQIFSNSVLINVKFFHKVCSRQRIVESQNWFLFFVYRNIHFQRALFTVALKSRGNTIFTSLTLDDSQRERRRFARS